MVANRSNAHERKLLNNLSPLKHGAVDFEVLKSHPSCLYAKGKKQLFLDDDGELTALGTIRAQLQLE